MRVPDELKQAADLGLVVVFQAAGLGKLVAVRPWREVAAAKPDGDAFRAFAQAAEQRGDHATANRLWLEAAAAHPQEAEILNNAAWALVTCPEALRQPAKAVELAREAVRLSPESAHIIDTLAEALLQAGKLDEAQQQNERLLQLEPDSELGLERRKKIATARRPAP